MCLGLPHFDFYSLDVELGESVVAVAVDLEFSVREQAGEGHSNITGTSVAGRFEGGTAFFYQSTAGASIQASNFSTINFSRILGPRLSIASDHRAL